MSLVAGPFQRDRALPNVLATVVAALVEAMAPCVGAADQVVIPNSLTLVQGNSQLGNLLARVPPHSERYQQVCRGSEIGSGITVAIAFRRHSRP